MLSWLLFLMIVVGIIILYLNQLTKRIKKLEKDVQNLKQHREEKIESHLPPKTERIIAHSQTVAKPVFKTVPAQKVKDETVVKSKITKPTRTRSEWESLIGGKWLNWIGALALIIAVGFFLKYAIDKNWISETVRVLVGAGVGFILLVLGHYFYKRQYDIFAQGVIGAGISILYLSVYASFNFYYLVSQPIAFMMMSAATAIGFFFAIRYNSITISILSWLGGFLTPFLLANESASEVGLFAYIILFDLGVLLIVINKEKWWVLEPLLLASTYVTFAAWYGEEYQVDVHLSVIVFLTIIWLLFSSLEFYRLLKSKLNFVDVRSIVNVLNILLYYIMLYIVVDPVYSKYMGLVTFFIAVIYMTGFFILRHNQPDNRTAHIIYALSFILHTVVATSIQFNDFMIVGFWALEAFILAWLGTRWKLIYIWHAAFGLLILTIAQLILTENMLTFNDPDSYALFLNPRSYTTSFLIFVIFFMATISGNVPKSGLNQTRSILQYFGSLLLLIFLSVETLDYFRIMALDASSADRAWYASTRFLALAIAWMVYALVMIRVGLRILSSPLVLSGLGASFLAVVEVTLKSLLDYVPIEYFNVIFNERVLTFVVIISSVFLISNWLRKNSGQYPWISDLDNILRIVLLVLIFMLITSEIRDMFTLKMSLAEKNGSYTDLANLQQLSLSGAWLFYSIILMVIGLWRRQQSIRISSIVLFGFTILKIFIYDLSFLQTPYRIVSFLILGVLLLTVSYLYHRYKEVILGE